jgi:type IV conjugative transfer system protein TraE
MEINNYQQKLKDVIKKRDAFFTMAILSMTLCLLLAMALLFHRSQDRIVIVPANFQQSFWVNKDGVSASYLAEMTRYFATLELNMTPESSDYQVGQVLKYTDPKQYGAIKAELIKYRDTVKNEGLTTAFFPVDVQVNLPKFQATIVGDLSYFVGKQETNTQRVTYLAQYRFNNGRLYLSSFQEVEKHA